MEPPHHDHRILQVLREAERILDAQAQRLARLHALLREVSAVPLAGPVQAERAALLVLLDIERTARDACLLRVEEVRDARTGRLLRELGQVAERQVHAAQGALALADRRHGRGHESRALEAGAP